LWYEIETDSTTARTMNYTNRGFVLYHLLPTGGLILQKRSLNAENKKSEAWGFFFFFLLVY